MPKIPNTVMYNGKRMVCKCFDNERESFDRYTVVFKAFKDRKRNCLWHPYIGASEFPFHPQGFGTYDTSKESIEGNHLGKRIPFDSLPKDVQRFVHQIFEGK